MSVLLFPQYKLAFNVMFANFARFLENGIE